MKYIAAAFACLGILFLYAALGAYVFHWQYAGGAIPQLLMLAAMVGAWRSIVRKWPKKGARTEDGGD